MGLRKIARDALSEVPNVKIVYGEEIEDLPGYTKQSTDLQTLEARFAHDVDFTLLILESPGSIAELGTFTQLAGIRERLVVLLSEKFYRAESYIARGPLSLISKMNPNSVIYFNEDNKSDIVDRVLHPLTFYKYAHYMKRFDYVLNTMLRYRPKLGDYSKYISPIRLEYNKAIALIAILVGERPSYADLLLMSGLAPKQLNAALHNLFQQTKIEKYGSGRYRTINGYNDPVLKPFSTTAISTARAKLFAVT